MPTLPQPSDAEEALELTKLTVDIVGSAFPFFGPAISAIFGLGIRVKQEERAKNFFQQLEEYLKKIPQRVFESDEFVDAVRIGVSHYVDEPSEKKRQLILNLNRSLFTFLERAEMGSPFEVYFIFNDLLKSLSLPAADCLIHFQDKFKSTGTRYDIIRFFDDLHGIHGKRAFMELVNNALFEEEGTHEMPPSFGLGNAINEAKNSEGKPLGQKIYKIQPLGVIFTDWLKVSVKKDITL